MTLGYVRWYDVTIARSRGCWPHVLLHLVDQRSELYSGSLGQSLNDQEVVYG